MATDPRPTSADAQARLGQALGKLRDRAELTQQQAADQMGVTRQAWQKYEAGAVTAILRTDRQAQLAEAIGLTREDLLRELARLSGEPEPAAERRTIAPAQIYQLPVLGRVRAGPSGPQIYDITEPESTLDMAWMFGDNARTLRVAGDSMTGYVESGQIVIYDVGQWPRRGDGCVVELHSGEVYVKEYAETAQGVLKVRQTFPEEVLSFPLATVKGVYKIRFRGG